MKRLFFAAAALGLLALSACAAQEKAAPAPGAPQSASAGQPGARPAWQQEWEKVLAAAKQEGKVAVMGPAGAEVRQALTEPFTKKYNIEVEFGGGAGVEQAGRVRDERKANQYLWDVFIHGTSIHLFQLKPIGALDPLEPALILPEVTDSKNWFAGKLPFADKDHTSLLATLGSIASLYINPQVAKPEEFKSYKDLLNPKWKGKIASFDPRIPGAGLAHFTFYYQSKDLGPDFIRALGKQGVTFSRDYRGVLEWVAQGKYPIVIGGHGAIAREMKKRGAPLQEIFPSQLKEGGFLSSAIGTVALANKAPHPNAAKVYVNWLLGKEGLTGFSRAANYAPSHLDITTKEYLEEWQLPREAFFNIDTEEARVLENAKVKDFVKQVFGE